MNYNNIFSVIILLYIYDADGNIHIYIYIAWRKISII